MTTKCEATAVVKVLVEALRYYADPKNYEPVHHALSSMSGEIPVSDWDKGGAARAALKAVNGKTICG